MTLDIFYEKLSVLGEGKRLEEYGSFSMYLSSKIPKNYFGAINEANEGFQSFYFAMYLQHMMVKMPDITPTNFGLSVLTIQVDCAIDIYIESLKYK
jgi:hypothetical protein